MFVLSRIMRIYFLDVNNLQELNNYFKNLYINTISTFEKNIIKNKMAIEPNKNDRDNLILINELVDTVNNLKDPVFEKYFLSLGTKTLEQIRYASVLKHTDNCVLRATFDILFKYCLDLEFKISHLCCDNTSFKTLQLEILRDLRYKISFNSHIPPFV